MTRANLPGACVAAALSWVLCGAAEAEPYTMAVKLKDLDLRSTSGAYIALGRLQEAANAFCAPPTTHRSRDLDMAELKCRRDMTRRAIAKLNARGITSVFERPPTLYASRDHGSRAQAGGEKIEPL